MTPDLNFQDSDGATGAGGLVTDRDPEASRVRSRSEQRSDKVRPSKTGHSSKARRWLAPVLVSSAAAALGAVALYNRKKTQEAEHQHPAIGRFLDVDGVRLHYLEQGQGEPVVLIHGNGTMIQDFTVSGLVDRLADRYRVIVIDRPATATARVRATSGRREPMPGCSRRRSSNSVSGAP